jgi:hypothetical protein
LGRTGSSCYIPVLRYGSGVHTGGGFWRGKIPKGDGVCFSRVGVVLVVIPVHMFQSDTNRPSMGFQLFHFGQLHDGGTDVPETLFGEVGTGDVFREGGEVDA